MLYISIPSDKSAMLQKTELLKLVTGYYWRLTILIFGHGGYEICSRAHNPEVPGSKPGHAILSFFFSSVEL
ncbi:hypothetical protein AFLA_000451 [Aspergillus flavus NRRL3357]|nr:hypothetical protein AFLA_000451 [Aspergillus flavus NRRL3357]